MTTPTAERRRQLLEDIQAAVQAQDLARAVLLAREALDGDIENTLVLNLRAYWHEAEGRNADALADLKRANSLAPDEVPVWNALGLAYARLGRMADAVQAFDGAIRRDAAFAPAHFNKGWTSEDQGELDVARACYARAVELMPGAADPLARLAALAARQGDWPEARAQASRALALAPRHPLAALALAGAEVEAKEYTAAEQHLTGLLGEMALAPADRAQAQGALADLFDAQGRYEQAFDAYTERNRILRSLHQARFAGPGVETMPAYLAWLSAAFERSTPAIWQQTLASAPSPDGPKSHVFVLGFARSGTTLIEEILARDPLVATTQERDALSDSVREYLATPQGFGRLGEIGRGTLRVARTQYGRRLAEFGLDAKGKIVVDKQPFNTYKLPLIAKLFPDAKILFSVRDPRDVVLSCFRRQFRMNASTFEFLDLEATARLYDATMRLGLLFRERLALDVLQWRHEDLVADFDGTMRGVCTFIGLPWSVALRDFAGASARRAVATPSSAQIKRGLNAEGIGAWRSYRAQLEPVLPLLAHWVEHFGYPAQ